MKKALFPLFIYLLLMNLWIFSQQLSESELKSRELFSESLRLLFEGNKYEARVQLNQAMSGEIYITDIPKLWYYAAKLDLQLGMIDKAIQDLENSLLFSTVNEEANTLLNFINSIQNFSLSKYATPVFLEISQTAGVKNSFERFYHPVDFGIINSNLYVLDSQNHLIFKTSNYEEEWIRLDEDKNYYSINADENLNRVYLGTDQGIYYFESYSPIVRKEIKIESTVESTVLTSETENHIEVLTEDFPFIIYDIDNAGRLIGYDPYNNEIKIIGYNGEILQRKKFDHSILFLDGALWHNNLYLVDYASSSVFNFDVLKNEVVNIIKLPNKTYISLDALPWNKILISSVEDGIEILEEDGELKPFNDGLNDKNISQLRGKIKIENGVLILSDLESNKVYLERIDSNTESNLYILNLYGLNYSKNDRTVTLKININDISGEKMDFLTKNIYVMDSGGRVPFNYYRTYSISDTYEYEINQLFQVHMPQINTDSKILTHGEINIELTPEKTIPFILSSSSLFHLTTGEEVDTNLENLAFMSGGGIIDQNQEEYLKDYLNISYKPIDYVEYNLFPPIISGINPASVSLLLEDKILVDTLFYYTEGDISE
ncbi:hypothetical protein C8D75_1440 [Petrotoga olearia]|uniref:Uncharacterized protein n=3 Tax=Petrotoga olearia TaxID=156203 RepID=A0A2K1P085_9BACT|nr:hypothetical protein X929_06420 [Petrotoga olearia DSM 13574]RMA71552.1 hypothetical protein C8D75_1440 [Petrotoga olearia]